MSRDSNSQLRDIVYEGGGLPEITIKKLQAYITSKVNEARIDELKELPAYKYGSWQAMTNEWIDARIKELQSKKIKE